jgi:hypothetical protein
VVRGRVRVEKGEGWGRREEEEEERKGKGWGKGEGWGVREGWGKGEGWGVRGEEEEEEEEEEWALTSSAPPKVTYIIFVLGKLMRAALIMATEFMPEPAPQNVIQSGFSRRTCNHCDCCCNPGGSIGIYARD